LLRRKRKEGPAGYGKCVEKKRSTWLLLAGLALIALLAAVVSCGITSGKQRGAQDPAGDEPQAGADLEHPSLGNETAPVVLVEYGDYQ
jgi:protein-disulfide isomerase